MKIEVDPINKMVKMSFPERTPEQILDAMSTFDKEQRDTDHWQNWESKQNHKYAISHSDKLYPVKQIISIATGVSVSDFSGGKLSNDYIEKLGFKVVPLREPLKDDVIKDEYWENLIKRIRQEHIPEERISARIDAERDARAFLESRLGHFNEDDLKQFFNLINTDFTNGKSRKDRFSPAFMGAFVNRINEQIEIFNEWAVKFFQTPSGEIDSILEDFWSQKPLAYAGIILPTTLLYLRSPQDLNILCKPMIAGMARVTGESYSEYSAKDYFRYNEHLCSFRDKYNIQPQELDIILWHIGHQDVEPVEINVTINPPFPLKQCALETGIDESELERWIRAIERKKQAIFYGPPGTGKTFIAEKLSQHLVAGGDGLREIVQFHPSYSYEDFIQGIRPQTKPDGSLHYPVVKGRFLEFCEKAGKRQNCCVIIIDEINRANLARVFGELMFLLEYRDSPVPLACGNSLTIPSNVRIIGTMNTADRSIALVDHALRRRFAFLALYPRYDILESYHENTGFIVSGLIEVLRHLITKSVMIITR